MASRRKFSDEYKREVLRLATEPGVTKSQVGREPVVRSIDAPMAAGLIEPGSQCPQLWGQRSEPGSNRRPPRWQGDAGVDFIEFFRRNRS